MYKRDDSVLTLDSCNSTHSKNYKEIWHFLQNGIQNFVIWLIHSREIALQNQNFEISIFL